MGWFALSSGHALSLGKISHAVVPFERLPRTADLTKESSMELPRRAKEDRYTVPGRYGELESQIRRRTRGQDVPILFIYAFDVRTRLGPFMYVDRNLIPGAPIAVASALHAAGLTNVRLVMQPWNPRLQPSRARLDGRPPEGDLRPVGLFRPLARRPGSRRRGRHRRGVCDPGTVRPPFGAQGDRGNHAPGLRASPPGRLARRYPRPG